MFKKLTALTLAGWLLAACVGAPIPQADLEARVAALEAQVGVDAAGTGHDQFSLAVAQYVMDTAGFHAMDEALNQTHVVDPGYLSTVNRVRTVLAQAPWPADLQAPSEAMTSKLDQLAAALAADNGEEAAALAAELHEVQHDFSHAIDNWLSGSETEHGHEE